MRKIRIATAFRRSNALIGVFLGIGFVGGGLYLVWDGSDSLQTAIWMILYTLAAAVLGGMFFVYRYRRFQCPDCGGRVNGFDDGHSDEDTQILRRCETCDTVWRI